MPAQLLESNGSPTTESFPDPGLLDDAPSGHLDPVGSRKELREQYQWLLERRDPASSLEANFLDELHKARHRLPDKAQYRPESQVYAESDFFYDRDGLKGLAVFVDGIASRRTTRKEQDSRERRKLRIWVTESSSFVMTDRW